MIIWIFGQPGSGKTTLSNAFVDRQRMRRIDNHWIQLDGDSVRAAFSDENYSIAGRRANIERIAMIAKLLESMGYDVIVSAVTPYKTFRKLVRDILPKVNLVYLIYSSDRGKNQYKVQDFEGDETMMPLNTDIYTISECVDFLTSLTP